jgi:hypothetical protein
VIWADRIAPALRARPAIYRAWGRLKSGLPLSWLREREPSPRRLASHARRALTADSSHAGEAAYLRAVLSRLGIDGGYVVDIAAGDGVTQSCTLQLFRDPRWRGLAVEMDANRFRLLSRAYAQFPGAHAVRARVTPDSVRGLLAEHDVPSAFEVLNLDVDSYDLFIAEALLTEYRPLVISMEVNEKIPPPVHFTVLYDERHVWAEDHFFGCSLSAAVAAVRPRGYVLESLQYNNAFFVRADVAAGVFGDAETSAAYDAGYRARADRRGLFPWNHDVEDLLDMAPQEVVAALERRFQGYAGLYRLHV